MDISNAAEAKNQPGACCGPAEHQTCCEPSEKATCCGAEQTAVAGSCGCT